jgi:hypothetical protein
MNKVFPEYLVPIAIRIFNNVCKRPMQKFFKIIGAPKETQKFNAEFKN